ncbi:MAG: Zn-ribbon domain-containing OB-fold protein [Bacillota bacterium]
MAVHACNRVLALPKYVCSQCGGTEFKETASSGTGTIFSYTTIRVAPEKFAGEVTYHVGVIQLAEGVKITARVTVPEGKILDVGAPVQLAGTSACGFLYQVV